MMSAALVVYGILGLLRLPVRELPDVDPTIVNVLTVYPGASAEIVETEVTERLEDAISSAENLKQLVSESREDASAITVEFIAGTDQNVAAQDVRDRVARVRGELPPDIEEPVVAKQEASAQPIIWLSFFSDRFSTEELTGIADRLVKDRLQTVPGVSSVILGGEKKFAMRIWLEPLKMAALGVTVLDVERALREQNVELPSGRIQSTDRELTIQTRGQLRTVEDFERLVIRQSGTSVVQLRDVGRAAEGVENERSVARFNGKPAIGLGIVRQSRANTLDVAKGVKRRMEEIATSLPPGIEFDFPYDESIYVEKAVFEVFETLGMAFLLVVLTIFIFLRDVRSTFIPSLAIPVSVIATFGVLYSLGFSINIFTLLALVLAIGIVVDDAIVVLENIYRHIEEGDSPFEASIKTMREIGFAVITITLSLVAVFLPLAFVGGITGRLLVEFTVALAASVVCSAFVALTLTPMAAARLLTRQTSTRERFWLFRFFEAQLDRLARRYEQILTWSLNHRFWVVMLALGSLGLSYYFFQNLEKEFLPEEDKGRFIAMAITPEGSTPDYTDRMVRQMEKIAGETEHIESYFSAVALPFNGPGDPTLGFMFVRLEDGHRPHSRDIIGGPTGLGFKFISNVEGALAIPLMPKAVDLGFSQPFELVVSHGDLNELSAFTSELMNRLRQGGFLANVRSTFELTKPELRVSIDRERAGALGVSVADVSRTLQILFGGQDLSALKRDGKRYDVIVQLEREQRLSPSGLEQIFVRSESGSLIQLSNVIRLESGAGPNRIERFNRQRSATIQGTPAGVPLGTAVEKAEEILRSMPQSGYGHQWRGEARDLRESSGDVYFFMILAILVVYMVLGAQFESFVHPFTVMLALPLALLGAFGLLYLLSWVNHLGSGLYALAHYVPNPPEFAKTLSRFVPRIASMNMNIFSQVGLVLLIGLVTKNSILLVEFANQEMARGADAKTAMKRAGLIRLRPILMTSLATIAGILPIALGFGEAGEARRPLGVVAVGGMATSTILTLVVIPVFYTLIARARPNRASA
jgi:multidrug efflux pump